MAPRSPQSWDQCRNCSTGCFVAGKESVRCMLLYTGEYSAALHCGAPMGASYVAANLQCCLHRARGRGIRLYVVWGKFGGGGGHNRSGRDACSPSSRELVLWGGHEATDTGLAYAPVSQAHGHHHIVQCFACCTAAQTSSVPHQVVADCALALALWTLRSARTHHPPTVPVSL